MRDRLDVTCELRTSELDYDGRAPLSVLCRFGQEAAEQHTVGWGIDLESLLRQNRTWVLLKLHIRVDRFPRGRQEIRVSTWPSGVEGRFAFREFEYFMAGEAQPFAAASSAWAVVDLTRGRPVRIKDILPDLEPTMSGRVIPDAFADIEPGHTPCLEKSFPVRLSDLDINRHVNNLHYIEWVVESVPDPYWDTHETTGLQVEFRAPARFGDVVRVYTFEQTGTDDDPAPGFIHTLKTDPAGPDLIRARTRRRPRVGN